MDQREEFTSFDGVVYQGGGLAGFRDVQAILTLTQLWVVGVRHLLKDLGERMEFGGALWSDTPEACPHPAAPIDEAVALAVSRSVTPVNSPANSALALSPVVQPYIDSPQSSQSLDEEPVGVPTPAARAGVSGTCGSGSVWDSEPSEVTGVIMDSSSTSSMDDLGLSSTETPESPHEESAPKGKGKAKGKAGPPPLKGKGKGTGTAGSAASPSEAPPQPPAAPAAPAKGAKGAKGKGKGPPPPPRAPPKGKGKEAPVGKRPSFRVSVSGLKHHVAAFHDLSFADVKLKEEEWTQLHSLFHKEEGRVSGFHIHLFRFGLVKDSRDDVSKD